MKLTTRELATVLAALRYWQETNQVYSHMSEHFDDETPPLDADQIDDLCERLNFGDPAADPDPIDFCSNLHSPELDTLIPAIIAAYESIRVDAQAAAAGTEPIAIVYDRIGNGEDPTPFGYCPPSAVPVLHRHGTIVATSLP